MSHVQIWLIRSHIPNRSIRDAPQQIFDSIHGAQFNLDRWSDIAQRQKYFPAKDLAAPLSELAFAVAT